MVLFHNGGSVDVDSWFCSIMVVLLMLIHGSVVVDAWLVAARIVCGTCTLFCYAILTVLSSFTIISLRKSALVALL